MMKMMISMMRMIVKKKRLRRSSMILRIMDQMKKMMSLESALKKVVQRERKLEKTPSLARGGRERSLL